ncbi:MAG: TMEM175 family protein [Pseudomonadota bacterium]
MTAPDDRERTQLERLTFFSDAVFAIAITLLVIEVRVPEVHPFSEAGLRQALLGLTPKYAGFVVSFFVIGRFWIGHHRLFGMLRRADNKLIFANLLLLLGIAFMPFPTAVFSDYVGSITSTMLYAGWLVVAGLFNWRLIGIGLHGDYLLAGDFDPAIRRQLLVGRALPIALGVLAMVAVLLHPALPLPVLLVGALIGSMVIRVATRAAPAEPAPEA